MLPEINKILYPTDMSETSNHAFGYAASLANRYDALITIIHILKNPMHTSENLVTNVIGNTKWQELLDQNKTEVVEKDYDMIIMGAHGHGAISGAVMGSVSSKVLRKSPIPVLVVRLADED